MYQFFVGQDQVAGNRISIIGSDVNHIRNVLRMKSGERVRVSISAEEIGSFEDKEQTNAGGILFGKNEGRSFFGVISEITEEEVIVSIESEDETGTELSNRIYLFQGLPKGDKMELIIQKVVELGAYEIIPVAMKNCVVKLDAKKAASKVTRWQAIAESAAKQSKRTLIPTVELPMTWKEALRKAAELDVVLVPYENERGMEATREVLRSIKKGQSIGIFVGPEGGFAPEEIEGVAPLYEAKADKETVTETDRNAVSCVHRISLGRRILRTETAGLATLAMLVFCLDD